MIGQVIHHERLAWDTARVIARTLESNHLVGWLRDQLSALFGADFGAALLESHTRMWASSRPDAPQVEIGIWRAKLEDVLQADMSLCEPLVAVLADAATRTPTEICWGG